MSNVVSPSRSIFSVSRILGIALIGFVWQGLIAADVVTRSEGANFVGGTSLSVYCINMQETTTRKEYECKECATDTCGTTRCPEGSSSEGSGGGGGSATGGSNILNASLRFTQDSVDYDDGQARLDAGCAPCGDAGGASVAGMPPAGHQMPGLDIHRIHRPDFSGFSNLGPGVFTNFDMTLDCRHNWPGRGDVIFFENPSSSRVIEFDLVGGAFQATNPNKAVRGLQFYDASQQPVTNFDNAATAVVTRNDGWTYHFDIHNARFGRPTAIRNRNGQGLTLNYVYPVSAGLGVLEKRKLTTITDAYGRVATVTYQTATVGGRYVISRIDLPNGEHLSYAYNDPNYIGLAQVAYPDGTTSVFSQHADTTSQCVVYDLFDAKAQPTHRAKSLYLSQGTWVDPQTLIPKNQSANRIRMVVNGADEVDYLGWMTTLTSSAHLNSYVYTGGGFLQRYESYITKPLSVRRAVAWDLSQNPSTYTWETRYNFVTDADGRLIKETDGLGHAYEETLDPNHHMPLTATYPDTTTVVRTYTSDQQVLTETDRIGRQTVHTYDANGNRLTTTRGYGTAAAGTWSWTYNAKGQPLTATDANGNVTDYAYTSAGYLTSVTHPADIFGQTRAVETFAYDSAGRLTTHTDPDNRTVVLTYDADNRVIRRDFLDGSWTATTYGTGANANLVVSERDRNGNLTTTDYDAAGRPTLTTYAAGTADAITEVCTYLAGTTRKVTCTRGGETTTTSFDHALRPVATAVQPRVGVTLTTTTTLDTMSRALVRTDAYGRRTFTVFDVNNRAVRQIRERIPGGYAGATTQSTLASLVRPTTANPAYTITDTIVDAAGQPTARIDGRGIRSTSAYDARGRVTASVEADAILNAGSYTTLAPPEAARTEYTYDNQGNMLTVTLPRSFARALPGGAWSAGSQGSFRTSMTYTARNLRKTMIEADGLDAASQVRAERATTAWTYSLTGKVTTTTDPRLNTTTNTYGVCCDRLVKVTDPSGAETIIGYDHYGNRTSVTDPNGNVTLTTFDARHRVSSVTNGENETTTYTYDDDLTDSIGLDATYSTAVSGLGFGSGSNGSAVAVTNPALETTLSIHDGLGRTVRSVDPLAHATTVTYDTIVSGLVETSQSDPLSHVTASRIDGAGLTRTMIDALSQSSTAAFDANGNRVQSRDPNGIGLDCVFDARNRDTTCTDTAGTITSKVYDVHGNLVTQTDALLNDTVCTYDARDRKVTCTDRISATTTFTYDLASNLLTITDAQSGVTEYAYDSRNLLIGELFPTGQAGRTQRAYAYDAGRRLIEREVSTIPASGFVEATEYAYDDANRLLTRSYDDSLNDTFTYDPASRLLTAVSARYGSTVTLAYDAASRLTSEALALANGALSGTTVSAATYTVGYDYDADNRLTDITYPTGSVVERSYTDRNQLDTVKLNAVQIADRAYDNAGRLTSTVLGNGLTESRGYIANDNLIATIAVPGVTDFTYTYDANKRKLSETDGIIAANTQTFSYDDQDRLTAWTRPSAPGGDTQSWNLSAVGDWTSTTRNSVVENRTHTAVHEVTGINSNPLTYDAKGNLSGDDRNVSYAWDPENRLVSAIIPSSASPTFFAANATYQYDALGRRIAKTVNGQTTVYLCGGAQVLVELDRTAIPSQAQLTGSESDGSVANASLPVASGGILPGTGVIRINFQPATTLIPAGYYADKGKVYGVRTNGMSYGWALTATSNVVARNGAVPVPELDTLALMDPTSSGTTPPANVWEVALPNGSYPVIVVAGDPLHRDQTNDLQIENQSVTDLDPSSSQTYEQGDYDGYAVIVTVADGKLSISQRSGGINAKLCFVEIGPEGTTIDSATLTRLADLMQQATDHTALTPASISGSREYVYGSYVDELISYTVGSDKYFVHANHLYSPSGTTNAAGAVVERYRYDAYGKQTVTNAAGTLTLNESGVGQARGFTGYILDKETGLYYARSRMYDGNLGRFVGRDRLGMAEGINLYLAQYIPNRLDPTGLSVEPPLIEFDPDVDPDFDPIPVDPTPELELPPIDFPTSGRDPVDPSSIGDPNLFVQPKPRYAAGGTRVFFPHPRNSIPCNPGRSVELVSSPEKPEWDRQNGQPNTFLDDASGAFPGAGRFSSPAKLNSSLGADIKNLTIVAHGSKNGFEAGGGFNPPRGLKGHSVDISNAGGIFSRDKFCCGCEIWLLSCNVGNGSVAQAIANSSGCIVYAYERVVYARVHAGKPSDAEVPPFGSGMKR